MSVLEYCVAALPKLDNQEEIQLLREKYDPRFYQTRPYIAIVPAFRPATLDELESVSAFLSQARRRQPPVAVTFLRCVEVGDRLVCPVATGQEGLAALQRRMLGASPGPSLTGEPPPEPVLVIGRVSDPDRRIEALTEANRLGRTLGLIDSVSLIGIEQSEDLRLVASYPFGIGRVDYFDTSAVGGS
ncbi:MAG: hypothetical protein R6X12_02170 [bacterium]